MKMRILPILCIAVLVGCTTKQAPEPTTELGWFTPHFLSPETLQGQVKTLEEKGFLAVLDGDQVKMVPFTEKLRDSAGWSAPFIAYFDPDGLIQKVDYMDDEGGVDGYWKPQVEDGRYTEFQWIEGDSARNYGKYGYDEAGHLSEMFNYRAYVDTLINKLEVVCNEKGEYVTWQFSNSKGEDTYLWTFEYDDGGNITYREIRDKEGKLTSWFKNTYDENGLELTQEGMAADSSFMFKTELKYSEYDEKGNWMRLEVYEDGKLFGIDERTLTYY